MKKIYKIILILFLIISIISLELFFIRKYIRRSALRKLAFVIFEILNKHDIEYWTDFGTLLGIIRNDDIILGDNDIDISVVDSPELYKKMKLVREDIKNTKFINIEKQDWDAYRITYFKFPCDLYINKKDMKNKKYIGATGPNSDIPMEFVGNIKNYNWKKYNINIKVPENIHKTLVWRYGKDYKIPKQNFKGRDSANYKKM